MGSFGSSFARELGKNTGKWASNKIFGDGWSTPHRIILERERHERKAMRDEARAYKLKLIERQREQRQFEREMKQKEREEAQYAKEKIIEDNTREVNNYNNYIEVLQSVHRDYSNPLNWDEILDQPPPQQVSPAAELESYYREYTNKQVDEKIFEVKGKTRMSFAKHILGKYYTPRYSWLFKIPTIKIVPILLYTIVLLVMTKSFITGFSLGAVLVGAFFLLKHGSKDFQKAIELEKQINELEANRETWFREYMAEQDEAFNNFQKEQADYKEMIAIADGVKKHDEQSFVYAINFFKPFEDLKDYGSDISYSVSKDKILVDFYVHSEDVIPKTTKRLLRKGLEIKEDFMPVARFNEIYQDYVCSCILRIAKEVFALLPIDKVLVNAKASLLNTATGTYEDQTIVSVLLDRSKTEQLNFELLDPSDSMRNFVANMSFKKAEGFYPIAELAP